MRTVIERHGHTIKDGIITYDDRMVAYAKAELIHGSRLDRRKNYAIIEGKVCEAAEWTASCSGCTYEMGEVGSGCHECGYTGKRRHSMWMPLAH